MTFFVYLLLCKNNYNTVTYAGYTIDLKKRIKLHNSNKGAKFTKGRKWKIIYKKKYSTKSQAMKEENKLKKNRLFRKSIINNYLKKI
mgnify:CR=1 FL=1